MLQNWMQVALLAVECQQVVGLRVMKMTLGGPAATREARRMVEEKIAASLRATASMLTGASADKVIADYRKLVRANGRRLSKGR